MFERIALSAAGRELRRGWRSDVIVTSVILWAG